MQLKYVQMQGFKSFPDKTVINFSRGITAIVGPNGSGKSNIGDAFRWVMGETSSKSLRGSKMEDVIFDGSAERKPMGMAEVIMVFDNSDRTLAIDYDEVSIGRRCYRSGESEYFINRSSVRLRDIQDLLFDTGLGKQGYSIIGQGAITSVIEAKSADRRYLFEEAAGISKFKNKKEDALRRLDRTQENITRVNDIINELAQRIGPLQKQAEKARKYIQLRNERKTLEISLWVMRLDAIDEQLDRARRDAQTTADELRRTAQELAELERRITESAAESESATARIEQLRAQVKELDERAQAKQTQIVVAGNDIEHLRADIARTEASAAASADAVESSREQLRLKQEQKDALTARSEQIKANIEAIAAQLRQTDESRAEAERGAEEINARTLDAQQRLTALRIRLGAVEQSLTSGDKFLEDRRRDIQDARERMQVLAVSRQQAAENVERTAADIDARRNVHDGYLVKLQGRQTKLEAVDKKLSAVRLELSDRQSRLNVLNSMQKHYEGFQNSVKTVMDAAGKGTLSGIEGTVAELIRVDGKYSTAVETALGGALQNIVTTDERAAKNAIYFLKSRNAGRATFLPITNIKATPLRGTDRLRGERGFVGLASELAECDGRYRGIIDFLLCRTVVAEDMDSASAIARANGYSFRTVTLDGQTVNVGGSLTGGSAAKNFGILGRRGQIEELTGSCAELRQEQERLEREYKDGKQDLDHLRASADAAEAELRQLSERLIAEKGELQRCDGYIENMRRQEDILSEELGKLTQSRMQDDEERLQLEEKIGQTEADIRALEAEAADQSAAIAKINEQRDKYSEDSHEEEKLLVENVKSIENVQALIDQAQQQILAQQQDSEQLGAQTDRMRAEIEAKNAQITSLQDQKAELERESAETGEQIRALVQARAAAEQQAQKLRGDERDRYALRERLSRDADKLAATAENLSEEKDSTISRLWDEYELTLSQAAEQRVQIEDRAEAERRAASIKASMKALGDVNPAAIDEYAEVKQRHDELTAQVDDLDRSRVELEKLIADLTERMQTLFSEKFETINSEFKRTFRELFGGGSAELKLEQPGRVLDSGIEIFAAPPGKVIKNLMLLSGGERALTAIALYFAILKIKPAPFCLLDEIEAALDEVNVSRYAQYLHRHDKTQFIAITHRRGTMEAADSIYGVTMREKGVSRILSVDLDEVAHKYS